MDDAMTLHGRSLFLILAAVCVGCAGRGTAHVAPNESLPHISWEIRSGGDTGEADFVCGSAKRLAPCVLPATRPEGPTMTTVHVYVHGIAEPTTYVGKIDAPFVQDFQKLGEVNTVVPAGSKPVGVTIAGAVVTTKPGSYTLGVRLEARQAKGAPVTVAEEVPVTVK